MGGEAAVILVLVLGLACSFLLSGMEAGVFALSRVRIRQQMRVGNKSAQLLHGYLANPERFLWTILAGNAVANFVVLSLVISELFQRLSSHPFLFVLILLGAVYAFFALFDLLPKVLFQRYPNRLCLFMARPFRFIHLGLAPLVAGLELCSRWMLRWTGGRVFTGHLFGDREELRLFMEDPSRGLRTEEQEMISGVLDLQDLTVRQIAIPMEKAVTVSLGTPMDEVLETARHRGFTRFPVWQGEGPDRRIIGVVSLKSLLYMQKIQPDEKAGQHLKPALYLPEDLRLEAALRRMQRSGQRLAIVLGRDRRELGIISLQDILRAIFGEVSL